MAPTLRQATLITFDPATWTALVQVDGADSAVVMAVGRWIPAGMLAEDDQVGVLLFDQTNPEHGLIVGPYGGVPAGIGARVYNSAAISIANATSTNLTFDSERYDNGSLHSTSVETGRLTAPVAGRYLVTGHIRWGASATGMRSLIVRVGTTDFAQSQVPAGSAAVAQSIATLVDLAAGDFALLRVFQNSTAALDIVASGNISPEFAMHLLP